MLLSMGGGKCAHQLGSAKTPSISQGTEPAPPPPPLAPLSPRQAQAGRGESWPWAVVLT